MLSIFLSQYGNTVATKKNTSLLHHVVRTVLNLAQIQDVCPLAPRRRLFGDLDSARLIFYKGECFLLFACGKPKCRIHFRAPFAIRHERLRVADSVLGAQDQE